MGRRKRSDRSTRTLLQLGKGSIAVTLPIEFVRELKWRPKKKVTVVKQGDTLVVSNWRRTS